ARIAGLVFSKDFISILDHHVAQRGFRDLGLVELNARAACPEVDVRLHNARRLDQRALVAYRTGCAVHAANGETCRCHGQPFAFGRTVNLPGVIMPIPQLKPYSPLACGTKEIVVVLVFDRIRRMPRPGDISKRPQGAASLASMRHSTGTPSLTVK